MINKFLTTLLLSVLLVACATTPTGRSQLAFMPDQQVASMGLQAVEQIKKTKPTSTSDQHKRFVRCVADAIIREVGGKWEVVVFEDKSMNAFALPGNKIGVHTGLINLVDTQDQLASVIGHEVGHVLARHSNERMSQKFAVEQGLSLTQAIAAPQSAMGQTAIGLLGLGAEYGLIKPYSRLHEREADQIGLKLMARVGFDPRQSIILWQKMDQASKGQQPPEFLSTHPSHGTRIQELQQAMPQAVKLQQQAFALGKRPNCSK